MAKGIKAFVKKLKDIKKGTPKKGFKAFVASKTTPKTVGGVKKSSAPPKGFAAVRDEFERRSKLLG